MDVLAKIGYLGLRATLFVLKTSFYASIGGIACGLILLYIYQSSLIYPSSFPQGSREHVPRPDQYGMPDYERLVLTTQDNVKITGYLIKNKKNNKKDKSDGNGLRQRTTSEKTDVNDSWSDTTLIYFHANAGNMGHRLPIASVFFKQMNCNILMLSYRGYGHSSGTPSEVGLKLDAVAAWDYIQRHDRLKSTKVILYGQSLGGAVLLNLAAKYGSMIHAVIVENTFLSIPKLIPHVMPLASPFVFLSHQKWDSESEIRKINNVPMLFLSGSNDELIPPFHMKQLYDIALSQSQCRDLVWWSAFLLGKHNDTFEQDGYFERIRSFLDAVSKRKVAA